MNILIPLNYLKVVATGIFVLSSFFAAAQPNQAPNKMDAQGRKQGYWEKHHPETGKPAYKATFKDDKPIGVLQRFYEDGGLQAEIDYSKNGAARIYYPDSTLMAEGRYADQQREGTWFFYTPDSTLASEEQYQKGKKNGLTRVYYANGSIAEKINYKNDVKHGDWEQYYENGQPKLKAHVVNGVQYEGQYTAYYEDGKKSEEGKYLDGKKESSWYSYHPDGSIEVIYVYRNGNVAEEHPQNGLFEKYFNDDIMWTSYTYKNGKKHGPFKEFFHQGEWRTEEARDNFGNAYPVQRLYGTQVQKEGKYFEGELHGQIITYDTKGKVVKKETYDKGVKVP
jgi:antitoxin component YwqK of YwqJK toxin-antitoxin module